MIPGQEWSLPGVSPEYCLIWLPQKWSSFIWDLFILLGHNLQYSGVIPGSTLRNFFWECLGNHLSVRDWTWLGCVQGKHPILILLFIYPHITFSVPIPWFLKLNICDYKVYYSIVVLPCVSIYVPRWFNLDYLCNLQQERGSKRKEMREMLGGSALIGTSANLIGGDMNLQWFFWISPSWDEELGPLYFMPSGHWLQTASGLQEGTYHRVCSSSQLRNISWETNSRNLSADNIPRSWGTMTFYHE